MNAVSTAKVFLTLRIALVAISLTGLKRDSLADTPARFWISTSGQQTSGPEAPAINLAVGTTQRVYIWGQPMTDALGRFKQMQNISLNLVPETPDPAIVDFLDTFTVYNPSGQRYEFAFDSASVDFPIYSSKTQQEVQAGQADSINKLTTVVAQTSHYTGIGLNQPGDNSLSGSSRAWLIASVDIFGMKASGVSKLHLQIGSLGISDVGESTGNTSVVFGSNPNGDLAYNGLSYRNLTLVGDPPDLIVTGVQNSLGDLNQDGSVNQADIQAMLTALTDVNSYKLEHGFSTSFLLSIGDMNHDSIFSNLDIQALLTLLKIQGGGAAAVSEPNSFLLVITTFGAIALPRSFRKRA